MKKELQELGGTIENILRENKFFYSDEEALAIAYKILDLGYHKTVWHKVADGDLPKNDSVVLAFYKPGYYATSLYLKNVDDETGWWYGARKRTNKDIIAWTELPEYKE